MSQRAFLHVNGVDYPLPDRYADSSSLAAVQDLLLAILDEEAGRPPQRYISVLDPSGQETPLHIRGQQVATAMVWLGEESVLERSGGVPGFHG
jgi:hypothetical protein